jgi:cardiolipin synthase
MNLPNALTLLRILLVPAFLITVIYRELGAALVLFAVASLTDLLDGYLARRLGQKTFLGAFLDPVADKLLMTVSFVSLAVIGLLPPWLAVLAVAKDLFVSIGMAILYFSGLQVAALPTLWGKQTTFLQVIAVVLSLLFPLLGKENGPLWWLFVFTGGVTIFSGMHYIFTGIRSLPPSSGADPGPTERS